MKFTLPPNYQSLVEKLVEQGDYHSPMDAVCDGLELVQAQVIYRAQKRKELQAAIDVGYQQMLRGEVVEVDPMDVFEEIDEEFRAKNKSKSKAKTKQKART